METLKRRSAIVTGGTRGIGRAIAESLLREGANVAICGRSADSTARAADEMKALGNVIGCAADVTDQRQVATLFEAADRAFGSLDILVNNVGEAIFRRVGEMTTEEWHRQIDVNLNSVFYCSREALTRFAGRSGFIVNISSLAGKNAFSRGAGYNAAKAGLNIFAEAMMLDHRYDRVRVTTIAPGSVDTLFSGRTPGAEGDTSWKIAPEDIAEAVLLALRIPERTTISSIEIRPSQPKK
jgi:3-oxoacyl-[acyl-carrier protein] reductase